MPSALTQPAATLVDLARLAQRLALLLRAGDMIALRGDLGAGKTSFARLLIGSLHGASSQPGEDEVPSPTFALVQEYETPRMRVAHFDLYRLKDESELEEIGFADAMRATLVLVEWPERAGDALPADRFELSLDEAGDPDTRRVTLAGHGTAAAKVTRLAEIATFLETVGWAACETTYLQGDASQRAYARLAHPDGRRAILMDAPRQPDGPPVRDGLPYSRIAHLAEDVRPFVAVARALRGAGLSTPDILAADMERGLVLLEDLGDGVFGDLVRADSRRQEDLWTVALDTLVVLRRASPSLRCPLPDGTTHTLPRLTRAILEIESELLPAWYWPHVKGAPMPAPVLAAYTALWSPLIDRLIAAPAGWMLRDYHSPNLLWLPERQGDARVGVIDFQDALAGPWAHDVMSLLQDARVDVPADLEQRLLDRYCAAMARHEGSFDAAAFRETYAIYGALRATRLLGLWVRLLRRDGKPQYLRHTPRTWDYLARNLRHPSLQGLRIWYDRHFPPEPR